MPPSQTDTFVRLPRKLADIGDDVRPDRRNAPHCPGHTPYDLHDMPEGSR